MRREFNNPSCFSYLSTKTLGYIRNNQKVMYFQLDKHQMNMSSSLYDPIINQLIQHSTEIEGMSFQKESLDLVFVPSGLAIMFGYHLFLLYRCLKIPHTTVIGFENNDKKAWIESIMQAKLSSPPFFSGPGLQQLFSDHWINI